MNPNQLKKAETSALFYGFLKLALLDENVVIRYFSTSNRETLKK